MASKLSEEQQRQVEDLYTQGLKPSAITQELELTGLGRSVAAHCLNLRNANAMGTGPKPAEGQSRAPGATTRSAVAEMVEGIERLDELGEKRTARHTPQSPTPTKDPVETAKGAIETGIELASRGNGNGNGQPQGELLEFLTTVVTQQREAHANIMEQIQSRHTNDLSRIEKDHDHKMEELKLKAEADRLREQDYWARIETTRQESDKQRGEMEREQRKLVGEKLDTVNQQVKENLEHSNRLIEEREKSSDRYVELSERLGGELAEVRKEMGKDNGTQELIKHAISRLGEPIIRAIEKRGDNGNAIALPRAVGSDVKKGGANLGIGDKVKGAVKKAFLAKLSPYIKEGMEQMLKHLKKWPEVSMKFLVDLLWSWRMYADVSGYIQAAITFIVLNDIDELVEKAGSHLTDEARKALLSDKAKKWWAELQKAINERVRDEEKAQAAYDKYATEGKKKGEKE